MPKAPFNSHKPGKEPKGKKCPPFEEAAAFYIENETDRKRAVDFGAWLRKNKLSPAAGNNGYNWYVKFKFTDHNKITNEKYYQGTYHGCYIKLFNDAWHILPSKDILEHVLLRDELKEIIWDSIFPCYGCNYGCFKHTHNAEYNFTISGREFTGKGICLRNPICLTNPDDKTLDILKEILLKRKGGDDLIIEKGKNMYDYGMIVMN